MKDFSIDYFKADNGKQLIKKLENKFGENSNLLLLIGEENKPNLPELLNYAAKKGLIVSGAIFPGLIYDTTKYMEGVIALKLPTEVTPVLIKNIKETDVDLLGELLEPPAEPCASLVITDAFSEYSENFIRNLNNAFGPFYDFIGAGAGHLTLQQEPCLFYQNSFMENAALLIPLPNNKLSLGIKHGWERLSGPYVATNTDKKQVFEFNWESAADFYIPKLEEMENVNITAENFYDICKSYPFGLFKDGLEDIVRDPINYIPGESIEFISEVPENASLYLLKGTTSSLIKAAEEATNKAIKNTNGTIKSIFVVDCISRVLKLGDEFEKEIKQVAKSVNEHSIKESVFGVLSIGEIGTYAYSQTELFNKTIVIGAIYA